MNRRLGSRLDRLEQAVTPSEDGPTCRYHGQHCQMGRNWPLPYEPGIEDDLLDLIGEARRSVGLEVAPHPRELWAVDRHELVPPAELAREKQELDRLIAEKTAENDRVEAAMRGDDY